MTEAGKDEDVTVVIVERERCAMCRGEAGARAELAVSVASRAEFPICQEHYLRFVADTGIAGIPLDDED